MVDSTFPTDATSDATSGPLGYQPSTHVAQDVITNVQATFGDKDGVQIQSTDILRWINQAQDTIANRTRPLKARAYSVSIAGVSAYKFPEGTILQVESLHYGQVSGGTQRLKNVSFAQAERDYIGDLTQQGEPQLWWEWSGTFNLWPVPPTVQSVTLYYTMTATPVASTTDKLGLPDKYFETILAYCMQQAYELDENMTGAQMKSTQFSNELAVFEDEEREAQHSTYGVITFVDQGY